MDQILYNAFFFVGYGSCVVKQPKSAPCDIVLWLKMSLNILVQIDIRYHFLSITLLASKLVDIMVHCWFDTLANLSNFFFNFGTPNKSYVSFNIRSQDCNRQFVMYRLKMFRDPGN